MRTTTQAVIGATLGLVLIAASVRADDRSRIVGTWKLVSFDTEDVHTKARSDIYGGQPKGFMAVSADGRFHAYVLSDWPEPVQSVWEDVAKCIAVGTHRALYYSGKYRVEAGKLIMHVQHAQHQGWIGTDPFDTTWTEGRTPTEEVRSFWLAADERGSDTLRIETLPMPNPNGTGNTIIGGVTWERTSD